MNWLWGLFAWSCALTLTHSDMVAIPVGLLVGGLYWWYRRDTLRFASRPTDRPLAPPGASAHAERFANEEIVMMGPRNPRAPKPRVTKVKGVVRVKNIAKAVPQTPPPGPRRTTRIGRTGIK